MQNVFRTNDAILDPIKNVMHENNVRALLEANHLKELGTYSKKALPAEKLQEFEEEIEKQLKVALVEGLPWDKEKSPAAKAAEKASTLPGTSNMGFGVKTNPPDRGLGSPDAINNLSKTTVKTPPERPISTNKASAYPASKMKANDAYTRSAPIVKANDTSKEPTATKPNISNVPTSVKAAASKSTPAPSADADERGGQTRKDLAQVKAIHGNKKLSAFGKAFQTARLAQGQKPGQADKTAKSGTFSFKGKKYTTVRKDEMNEDENLQELSNKTLGSYIKKAKYKLVAAGITLGSGSKNKMITREFDKRNKGIDRAADKMMKEDENLQELSKKTLGSYIKKASDDMSKHNSIATWNKPKRQSKNPTGLKKTWSIASRKVKNRKDGIERAVNKMNEDGSVND